MASQTEAVVTAPAISDSVVDTAAPDKACASIKPRRSKYRHVAAYHSQNRHSSLSRDSTEATSFIGFRNLMVLVLSKGRYSSMIGSLNDTEILYSCNESPTYHREFQEGESHFICI